VDELRTYGASYAPRQEDTSHCIESVWSSGRWASYQCSRKRGHGKDGLYCKTHDPERVAAKQAERDRKWRAQMDADRLKREVTQLRFDISELARKAFRQEVSFDELEAAVSKLEAMLA
jgi:hypothetical protein